MTRKRRYQNVNPAWYLWPVDNHPQTNAYLVKIIGEQNPECERRDVLCADGQKRDLYRSPTGYKAVRVAIAAMSEYGLKFEIFREDSVGRNARVVMQYNLWKPAVKKKAKAKNRLYFLLWRTHRRLSK